MNDSVRYERHGPVAWVTIDRPDARNALNESVRTGLFDAVARFEADDAAVLVLTGAGDQAFCAGGDLKEMADLALEVPPPDFLPMFGRNVHLERPTIAAVNGVAFAGGFLLAQRCELVPPRVALELLLTAEPIDARRAFEVGLVNRVVPGGELRATVQTLAETIATNAPLSVRAAKEMVYRAAVGRSEEAFAIADEIWEPVYRSEDAQEGPRAFGERRPPKWKGR